jgi:septal ring factor EnvC (AmiA/AmiB activator)
MDDRRRDSLVALEVSIARLRERHEQAVGERRSLAERLARLEENWRDAAARVVVYQRERDELRRRLERLLTRLEGLEGGY